MGIFALLEIRKLVSDYQELLAVFTEGRSASAVTLALGSASVALGQVGLNLVQWLGLRAFTAEAKV